MAKLIISRDGAIIDTQFIDQPSLAIGSAEDNDVRLQAAGVSRYHARIASVVNDDILEDLGSANGTIVNGEAVRQRVLQNNDVIEIADYQIRYRNHKAVDGPSFDQTMFYRGAAVERNDAAPERAVAQGKPRRAAYANRRRATLVDLRAPGSEPVEIAQLLRTVGDAERGLAVINARPHGYFITHVTGRAPARVNQQSVGSEPRSLANGDVIEVGGEQLRFVCK
jgi:hypothetical protein